MGHHARAVCCDSAGGDIPGPARRVYRRTCTNWCLCFALPQLWANPCRKRPHRGWPAVVPYNHPQPLYERTLKIPAFGGFDPARAHWAGVPVPPGFPFTIRKTIDSNDWQMVKSGSAQLQVLIRVSYINEFGNNCHALNVTYSPQLGTFTLRPRPSKDYCGGRPQVAQFRNYGKNDKQKEGGDAGQNR